jgi:hypothetical protein
MTTTQLAALSVSPTNTVMEDVASQESNGSISYNGVLDVLQQFDKSNVNATVMAGLDKFDAEVDAGTISASAYVTQMLNNVVQGNAANATWTGGGNSSVALGDLTASSTPTQFSELVDKWFLGTDNPSADGMPYQNYASDPLYGNAGAPQISDINQGAAGDCYFLAALGAVAQNDPSLIKNMIQSNGNGNYSVDFQVNGKDDYVTVDSELATNGAYGPYYAKTGSDDSIWVPLVEKAYAELMQNPDVTTGNGGNDHVNSYDATYGGTDEGLDAITGQSSTYYQAHSSQLASALATAMADRQNVIFASETAVDGLVAGHMYTVTNYNENTGMVTLRNPWGQGSTSANPLDVTLALSKLPTSDGFFIANGTAAKS